MDPGQLILTATAGGLAVLSPCALPMLPAFVAYYLQDRRRGVAAGLSAAASMLAGFMVSYALVGMAASILVGSILSTVFRATAYIGIALIVLGFTTGWTNLMERLPRFAFSVDRGSLSFLVYGIAYGVASMGCSLPVFILLVAEGAAVSSFMDLGLLFAAYGVGAGALIVPLTLSLAVASSAVHTRLIGYLPYVKKVSGVVIMAAGAYMLATSITGFS